METNTASAFRLALAALVCTTLTTNIHAQTPTNDSPVPVARPSLQTGIWPTIDGTSVRVNFENKGRGAVHVCLFDSRGKALYDRREFNRNYAGKFNLSDLPAGIYTIDLQSADTHVSQSISVNVPQPAPARVALLNTADYFTAIR